MSDPTILENIAHTVTKAHSREGALKSLTGDKSPFMRDLSEKSYDILAKVNGVENRVLEQLKTMGKEQKPENQEAFLKQVKEYADARLINANDRLRTPDDQDKIKQSAQTLEALKDTPGAKAFDALEKTINSNNPVQPESPLPPAIGNLTPLNSHGAGGIKPPSPAR